MPGPAALPRFPMPRLPNFAPSSHIAWNRHARPPLPRRRPRLLRRRAWATRCSATGSEGPAMTLDYALGGLVTVGLLALPGLGAGPPGTVLRPRHDRQRLDPDRAVTAPSSSPSPPPIGGLSGRRRRGPAHLPHPGARAGSSAASTASAASIRRASRAGSATPSACWPPRWPVLCCSTRCCGCRAGCPSTRPGRARCRPTSPSTPRSASSPTPTGRTTAARRRCRTSRRWPG